MPALSPLVTKKGMVNYTVRLKLSPEYCFWFRIWKMSMTKQYYRVPFPLWGQEMLSSGNHIPWEYSPLIGGDTWLSGSHSKGVHYKKWTVVGYGMWWIYQCECLHELNGPINYSHARGIWQGNSKKDTAYMSTENKKVKELSKLGPLKDDIIVLWWTSNEDRKKL